MITKPDLGRVAYWISQFLWLAVLSAVMFFFFWSAWELFAFFFKGIARLAQWIWSLPLKRYFYTVCFMAIFFYTARAIRAVARYFEAKASNERQVNL